MTTHQTNWILGVDTSALDAAQKKLEHLEQQFKRLQGQGIGGVPGVGPAPRTPQATSSAPTGIYDSSGQVIDDPSRPGGRSRKTREEHNFRSWLAGSHVAGGLDKDTIARYGGIGFAGLALNQTAGRVGSAISAYYGAEPGMAGGLASGNPYQAMSSVVQARVARQSAGWTAGIQGVAGAGSAGMMGYGVATMAANPALGAGLIAGSALLSIAGEWGSAAASSYIAKLGAKQQSAISTYQRVLESRSGYNRGVLGFASAGGDTDAMFGATEAEKKAIAAERAAKYGYSAPEQAQRLASQRRAGGSVVGAGLLFGMERAFGIQSEGVGAWERGFHGGGSTLGAPLTPANAEAALKRTLTGAMAAGLDQSRWGEYIGETVRLRDQSANVGLGGNEAGLDTARLGMILNGLTGFQATTAQGGSNQFGQSILQNMASLRMPADVVQSVLMRKALSESKTGYQGAMELVADKMKSGKFLEWGASEFKGMESSAQTAAYIAMTGMLDPATARKAAEGAGTFDKSPFSGAAVDDKIAEYLKRPELDLERTQASMDTIITFGADLDWLRGSVSQFNEVMIAAVEVMRDEFPAALRDMLKELRGNKLDFVYSKSDADMVQHTGPF